MKSDAKVTAFLVSLLTNASSCKSYQLFLVHVVIFSVGLYDKMHCDNTEHKNCSRTPKPSTGSTPVWELLIFNNFPSSDQ